MNEQAKISLPALQTPKANRIVHSDCIEVLQRVPPATTDFVLRKLLRLVASR